MSLPVLSIAQMRAWEDATWAAGFSDAEVIRRVGRALVQTALRLTRAGELILVLSGKGNNGADARATLEFFADRRVDTLHIIQPEADLGKLEVLLGLQPALVIDGLFGIGLNRPLDRAWVRLIECVNAAGCPVLSVDVPSGLNADTGEPMGAAVVAAVTVSVGAPKRGMLHPAAWPYVGRLEVADEVGLVPGLGQGELNWTLAGDFRGFRPPRPVAGHKGSFGHLAILAGSTGYHGAAVLSARGAQRAQPGLVTLFTEPAVYTPVAAQLQAVMVRPWSTEKGLFAGVSAILIGPGLAAPEMPGEIPAFAREVWREADIPVVVDASALDWLGNELPRQGAVRVITPHPGEAGRLLGVSSGTIQSDRPAAVRALSAKWGGCVVVLKGYQTVVGRSSGNLFFNSSGNPQLAQGGSGDVLAGFLAGLLAQPVMGIDSLKTARFAVWAHGHAADRLSDRSSNWIIEELLVEIGKC